MSQTAYGRGRSNLGKTHIADPEFDNGRLLGAQIPLCGNLGLVRTYKFGEEGAKLAECKHCLAAYAKRTGATNV
jgi:hypothetical protein